MGHISNNGCIMYFCFIMVEGTNLQHNLFDIIFDIYTGCTLILRNKMQNVKALAGIKTVNSLLYKAKFVILM